MDRARKTEPRSNKLLYEAELRFRKECHDRKMRAAKASVDNSAPRGFGQVRARGGGSRAAALWAWQGEGSGRTSSLHPLLLSAPNSRRACALTLAPCASAPARERARPLAAAPHPPLPLHTRALRRRAATSRRR